jgi:hypothetical protein
MHSTDVRHMVQSIRGQFDAASSAVFLANGKPVIVGPVTLQPRFNAVATSRGGSGLYGSSCTDELVYEPFAAGWAIGSVAAFAKSGVSEISYFSMDEFFADFGDMVSLTPAGKVLRALAGNSGDEILRATTANPSIQPVLAIRTSGYIRVCIGNLGPKKSAISLRIAGLLTEKEVITLDPWSYFIHDFNLG